MNFLKRLFDIIFTFFFLKIYKRIDRIDSTTGYSDLQFLFLAARDGWGEGTILEIGSYKGKSTVALALGSKLARRDKVYSIDHHAEGTKDIFFANLKKIDVSDYVITKIATSQEARQTFRYKIRLMFIDGNHEYDFVKKDILLWKDLLIDGGVLALHDYNWPGVSKAISELITKCPEFIKEATIGCTFLVSKKVSKNSKLFDEVRLFNKLKKILRPWK